MKSVLIFFAIIAVAIGQIDEISKICQKSDECAEGLKCIENKCSCEKGSKPEFESHPVEKSQLNGVYVCKNVVGLGCNVHHECNDYLDNSKCEDHRCVCKKEDNCKNGSETLHLISTTVFMTIILCVMKIW